METDRTCTKCKETQPIECYNKRSTKENTYRGECKNCQKIVGRAHYEKYKGAYISRAEVKRRAHGLLIEEYRRNNPCKKCGESRWYVLDFHHRDPSQKSFGISGGKGHPQDIVYKEIAKCDVLCSNCHRELHHLEK